MMDSSADTGLPEVCDKCDRDCPEPCEAFKRFVAIKTYIEELKKTAKGDRIYLGRFEVITICDATLKILEGKE